MFDVAVPRSRGARENICDPDSLVSNDIKNNGFLLKGDNPDARPEIIPRCTAKGSVSNCLATRKDPVSEPGGSYHIRACFKDIEKYLFDIVYRIGTIFDRETLHQLLCFA